MRQEKIQKKQNFLTGALILTVGFFLVKLIGGMFKIPLTWLIGEDGLGYFNTAYHLYGPIYSLAAAGFPIAISRLVAGFLAKGDAWNAQKIHRVSMPIFLTTGICGSILMLLCAPFYAKLIGNTAALPSMWMLAPTIFFSSLMAVYKGYWEGQRNMIPTAVSELIEAACKLLFGLAGAILVMHFGMAEYASSGTVFGMEMGSEAYARTTLLPYASAAAVLGVSIGTLIGAIYLIGFQKRNPMRLPSQQDFSDFPRLSSKEAAHSLVQMAVPIGIGAFAVNLSGLLDTTILQLRIRSLLETSAEILLQQYGTAIPQVNLETGTVPNYLFGCYSQATTLFFVVPSITQAFATSALPSVTTAWMQKQQARLSNSVHAVLRITGLFCIPTGLGLSVLSKPICILVFGDRPSGEITAGVLSILGIAAIFSAFTIPIHSMLQAIGRPDLTVKLLLCGLTIKAILTYFLTGIPECNLLGAAISTLLSDLFLMAAGLWILRRSTKITLPIWETFGKFVAGSVLSVTASWLCLQWCQKILPYGISFGISFVIAVIFYIFSLALLCAIHKSDILRVPKGEKIAKSLEKFHIIV